MSKVCQVRGKRAMTGNKVSHSNRKTKKTTQPNIQAKRYFIPSENRWVRLRVSTAAIRDIDKRGVETVVREMRARGVKV